MNEIENVFTQIYESNSWGGRESRSGPGSDSIVTEQLKIKLSELLQEYNILSIVDCACGDFNWMRDVISKFPNINYLGVDIVQKVIDENNRKYPFLNCDFKQQNIIKDVLPKVDLVICRDCLVHFSYENIIKFLGKFLESNSSYLLLTSFIFDRKNLSMPLGIYGWCPINFQKEPFSFLAPLKIIDEEYKECGGVYRDKSLLLWSREQLLGKVEASK